MGPIVCATRGGQASRRTQERAIALAKERTADLVFLCVVDPEFVGPVSGELAIILEDELRRLARCLLAIARARAEDQGIATTNVVLTGAVHQTIEDYLRQVGASALVIGAPRSAPTSHAFGSEGIEDFASAIADASGVETVVVT